jgi:PIN domain nuclease of toxin-antitoxin system
LRLLLDTHALIWWVSEPAALGAEAHAAISDGDNTIFVSAVSAMEVTTKFRLGKLPAAIALANDFENETSKEGFLQLPLLTREAVLAGSFQLPHKDPFDRLLIAQAMLGNLVLVSNESLFDQFGVRRVW